MSLLRIVLRDFVIVRQLELDLSTGFSVLSGETGAGKSILVDALQLVLGARADASVVREAASRTEISAEFALTPALRVAPKATSWALRSESSVRARWKNSVSFGIAPGHPPSMKPTP